MQIGTLEKKLSKLPEESFPEVADFLDYLRYKFRTKKKTANKGKKKDYSQWNSDLTDDDRELFRHIEMAGVRRMREMIKNGTL